jgi:amylosucrase
VGNYHVLAFLRVMEGHRLVVLANFADHPQWIEGNTIRTAGMGRFFEDLLTRKTYATSENIFLESYQLLWLHRV